MVAACIIRRHQHLSRGLPDPFAISAPSYSSLAVARSSTPVGGQSAASVQMEKANAQHELNKSLLRLTFVMQSSTPYLSSCAGVLPSFITHEIDLQTGAQASHSAIELLLMQPSLLDDLSRAVRGNYGIILSLLGCLDDGSFVKKLVDAVVDSCEHLIMCTSVGITDHVLMGTVSSRRPCSKSPRSSTRPPSTILYDHIG